MLEDKRVGSLNGEQEQLSKNIRDNSQRLLDITGELLNMTQVEAGKLQMMPKITKPIELIEYAIKANQVQADKFNIQIEVDYPQEKIPKLFVDSEKIAWVLTNLLSNAIRYSKENGRVVIGVRHKKSISSSMCKTLAKESIQDITKAFLIVISVYRELKFRVAVWDCPFRKTL